MTVRLDSLEPGSWFTCPWRAPDQKPCKLDYKTISSALVESEEPREFESRNKLTGEIKIIKQVFTIRETWALGTMVDPCDPPRKRGRPRGRKNRTKREAEIS